MQSIAVFVSESVSRHTVGPSLVRPGITNQERAPSSPVPNPPCARPTTRGPALRSLSVCVWDEAGAWPRAPFPVASEGDESRPRDFANVAAAASRGPRGAGRPGRARGPRTMRRGSFVRPRRPRGTYVGCTCGGAGHVRLARRRRGRGAAARWVWARAARAARPGGSPRGTSARRGRPHNKVRGRAGRGRPAVAARAAPCERRRASQDANFRGGGGGAPTSRPAPGPPLGEETP